jgi:hypothetical protein
VVRAQEGTTAREWPAGTRIEARLTAGMLGKIVQNQGDQEGALALGPSAQTTDSYGTAVGLETSSSFAGVAMGAGAVGTGSAPVAIGRFASAFTNGLAAGAFANAFYENSSAVGNGATAYGNRSAALGFRARAFADYALAVNAIPTIQREDSRWGQHGAVFCSTEAQFASMHIECGAAPTWQASTAYQEGDVVKPTAGGSVVYALMVSNRPSTFRSDGSNAYTTGTTEPTWPALYEEIEFATGSIADWVGLDFTGGEGIALAPNTVFFPREVAFICLKYANVSSAPVISVGTWTDQTLVLNNHTLTGITGAKQIVRIPITTSKAMESDIVVTVNTKAGGANSQFLGRFVLIGTVIELQG